MAKFTGTDAAETITPSQVSTTVLADPPGSRPGDDTDTIAAGGGSDVVSGGAGDDIVSLGGGNDLFRWTSGDGDDSVDGGLGRDTLVYTGILSALSGNNISIVRSGDGVEISNGTPVLNLTDIEVLNIVLGGGTDGVFVRDLTDSGVKEVAVDLGTAVGDFDYVVVEGSTAPDKVRIKEKGADLKIAGLSASIKINGADVDAMNAIVVNAGTGEDSIDATGAASKEMRLQFQGGDGNDTILGGKGGEWLLGGTGNDHLAGGKGADLLRGDTGRDVLEGGKGADSFVFIFGQGEGGRDRILDFKPGKDTILLWSDLLGTSFDADEFRLGKVAKDADDHILYDRKSGVLRWDADGAGGEGADVFAKVTKGLHLTYKDFDLMPD